MISLEQTRKYKINRDTMVIVRSRKDKDAEIYRTTVSLLHESADTKPLELRTQDEVKAYIAGIDLDDDQVTLFGSSLLDSTVTDQTLEELYVDAALLVKHEGKASTSLLQRRLKIGYGQAVALIEELEHRGIVSQADGSKPRQVLVKA